MVHYMKLEARSRARQRIYIPELRHRFLCGPGPKVMRGTESPHMTSYPGGNSINVAGKHRLEETAV